MVALSGCDRVFGFGLPDTVDANLADAPFDPDSPWGLPLGQTVLPIGGGDDPTLRGDQLELIYENQAGTLWVTRRSSLTTAWSAPAVIAELAATGNKTTPELSTDGLTLGYALDNGPAGLSDLAISRRLDLDSPWVFDRYLTELNSASYDTSPSVDAAGTTIVFSSDRTGSVGGMDLWLATRATPADGWSAPVPIAALNTVGRDSTPFLSADGLAVYFVRTDAAGGDLYVSRRDSTVAAFPTARAITELNTPDYESDPWVAPDHRSIYFIQDDATSTSILMYATR